MKMTTEMPAAGGGSYGRWPGVDQTTTRGFLDAGPGFVSVDCGASTGGVDNLTGIPFDADTSYIATGNTSNVKIDSTWAYYYLKTLRYFPAATSPKKNCYDLTVDASRQYLVRATFYHGGYAPLPSSGVITFKVNWASLFSRLKAV